MNTQINIPIYRALKLGTKDEYVEGNLIKVRYGMNNEYEYSIQVVEGRDNSAPKVDLSTLAIHFPDMLDSEGTKIFASLSEDRKGGDICSFIDGTRAIALLDKGVFTLKTKDGVRMGILQRLKDIKVTGIQE